jgi:hypothetical protein
MDGATYTFLTNVQRFIFDRNVMFSWIHRFYSAKKLKEIGDPNSIVAYVEQLETEIVSLHQEIRTLKIQMENKSADVQYWESVNRSGR